MRQLMIGAATIGGALVFAVRAEDELPLPPPIYNEWNDFEQAYVGGYCTAQNALTSSGAWDPYWCGPNGGCELCWRAFPTWYYQDLAPDPEYAWPDCVHMIGIPVTAAPLWFDSLNASYYPSTCTTGCPPSRPTYGATLKAIEGMECIQSVPLECTRSTRPVVVSARYTISIEGEESGAPAFSGAFFFLTALYDETLFEVSTSGFVYVQDDDALQRVYRRKEALPSFQPRMFQGKAYLGLDWSREYRQSEWRLVPDIVQVRLRDGRMLSEARGRFVQLTLHTLNWSGSSVGCPGLPERGDSFGFGKTDSVVVGGCLDGRPEDWHVDPPGLTDGCCMPTLTDDKQQAEEVRALGIGALAEASDKLPSLRAGRTRWYAGRTLAETLGNRAYWHAYEIDWGNGQNVQHAEDFGFLAVSLFGVWCAVDDLPGWSWDWTECGEHDCLEVYDPCSEEYYHYWTTDIYDPFPKVSKIDYAFNADTRLVGVGTERAFSNLREFSNWNDITLPVSWQVDNQGNGFEYAYEAANPELLQAVTGHDVHDGTRAVEMAFDAAWEGGDVGSTPLLAVAHAGGGASRRFEWYPAHDPPTQVDGKLKSITDGSDRVLVRFEYDGRGRLVKHSRGSEIQGNFDILAEYIYEAGADSDHRPIMEARFPVDDAFQEVIVRTFDRAGQVVEIAEYLELIDDPGRGCCMSDDTCEDLTWSSCLGAEGTPLHPGSSCAVSDCTDPPTADAAITLIDHHLPDEGTQPAGADPFYHQICTIGDMEVVTTRCVEKTTPKGDMSQYTFFDCDFNVNESYMAPQGITETPPEPIQHARREWRRSNPTGPDWGVWQVTRECDESRVACTDYVYDDDGYLIRVDFPEVTVGVNTGFRGFRTLTYEDKHRVDYETRNNADGEPVLVDYQYDVYDNPTHRIENPGADQIAWQFSYNAFGEETRRIDPDGYVQDREYNAAGQLSKTYTYTDGAGGLLIRQTIYTYEDGRLASVSQALPVGPFAKDEPERWSVTTYDCDDYGRLITRTKGIQVTTYEYDRQDRLRKIIYPDGIWKLYTRDGRGAIVATEIGPDPILRCEYDYDLNGNQTLRSCQGCPDLPVVTEYTYDEYNHRTAEIRKEIEP